MANAVSSMCGTYCAMDDDYLGSICCRQHAKHQHEGRKGRRKSKSSVSDVACNHQLCREPQMGRTYQWQRLCVFCERGWENNKEFAPFMKFFLCRGKISVCMRNF
jgi:hypothetical protein